MGFNEKIKNPESCKEKGAWSDGNCCCNCRHQLKINKHPWNKSKRFKGSISENSGIFVCSVQMDIENTRTGIAFERKHGYCELHSPHRKVR